MAEYDQNTKKLIGVIRDVTELKLNEKLQREILVARESATFKQNFIAHISHEIRTPLTAIEGMIEMLEKTKLDDEQKDYFDTVKFSSGNLRNIINEILDFARIEAGGINLNPVDFSVEELYARTRNLFRSLKKSKSVFETKGLELLPVYLNADVNRVFQVITNFISNAVKYADQGTITFEMICLPSKSRKKAFKVMVHDQGPGITPKLQARLFKPFSQIHGNEQYHIEGTGLGLSICKELVTLMGGDIGVISKQEYGTTFWFTFKAQIIEKKNSQSPKTINAETVSGRSLRIMMAEDKVINQKVISLILSSMGHQITPIQNGLQAVEEFEPGKYDLILMDIQMPVMDGIMATNILKEKYQDNLPPIVGLSANAFAGDKEKFIKLGMDDYLTKPVKSEDFADLIKRLGL
jgi:CheY-like chemotaxis protein/nitrogen-specific signal transduction histidine kinase